MIDEHPSQSPDSEHLDDREAIALLTRRVKELEADLKRAELRAPTSIWLVAAAFVACVIAFLLALYLAIAPYLRIGNSLVPPVISYISAFAVLYFAYLVHTAFRDLVVKREYKRAIGYAISNGKFVLSRAHHALQRAEEGTEHAF
ncbi:MAG TPA: hypothetical protein VHB47_01505 [Thermoanaerobaculia bacterium]|jgi:amino acid permease|nr:hypothetical protein [Thermoanaerobaculia bacterium]